MPVCNQLDSDAVFHLSDVADAVRCCQLVQPSWRTCYGWNKTAVLLGGWPGLGCMTGGIYLTSAYQVNDFGIGLN